MSFPSLAMCKWSASAAGEARLCAGLSLGDRLLQPQLGMLECVLIEVAEGVDARAPCSSQE